MHIISKTFGLLGQDGVVPRRVQMVVTDNLDQILAPNYFTNEQIYPDQLFPTDLIDMVYNYNSATKSGTHGQFVGIFAGGNIQLEVLSNDVILPVVAGDFVVFNDADGTIKDAGYSPTDPDLQKVVMFSGSSAIGEIPAYSDVAGSLSGGYSPSSSAEDTVCMVTEAVTVNSIPAYKDANGSVGAGYEPSNSSLSKVAMVDAPVSAGNIPSYSDVNGTIGAGYIPSDPLKTVSVMFNGTPGSAVAGRMAVFFDSNGTIDWTNGTAFNLGAIQSGQDSFEGELIVYPTNAGGGYLSIKAGNNSGDYPTTILTESFGQQSSLYVPDTSQALSYFIMSDYSGDQSINTGGLIIKNSGLTLGTSTGGGSILTMYPSTANTGNFNFYASPMSPGLFLEVTNDSVGQGTQVNIPDPGTATAKFALSTAPLVVGNLVKANATNSIIGDAGISILAGNTSVFAGGTTLANFSVPGITTTSKVTVSINSCTNLTCAINSYNVPVNGTLSVIFTAAPGANTVVSYIAINS